MLNGSIKNFFKYKGFLSRSGFLLSLIAIFLTFISFFKGIQILMFIPAFVLSIFLYSILENYFILKNFRLNFYSDKTGNNLKIFVKKGYKYNFIIGNVKQNGEIEFLEVGSPLKFTLNKNEKYDLILYLYGSFDIFRKIINIGKVRFNNDNETYEFYLSEKYSEDKNMQHLDNLKTSINNIPYIKEKKEIVFKKDNGVEFNIVSNENLRIVGDEKISAIHFLMVIFAFIGIVIEWEDIILNSLMIIGFIIVFFLRNKRGKIKNIFKNVFLILAFILMIFMTLKNQDMSGPGSVFLVHILTIVYLFPKDFKNSFLYIFLPLFVFVAISLFSNKIWFILLFLSYICLSIYLLFFISGTESFDKYKYKIGNFISKKGFIKIYLFIVGFMFLLFFVLPHGNNSELETNIRNTQNSISGFNEEISLENLKNIMEDSRKVIVVENITEKDVEKLGIEYFRGKRYNYFDGKKWDDKFMLNFISFKNNNQISSDTINLEIKYYLNGGRYLFLPAYPISIGNTKLSFGNFFNDLTVLRSQFGINEPINLDIKFKKNPQGEIIDYKKSNLKFNSSIDKNVENIFKEFIDSIPLEFTLSPELLTDYVKNRSGFSYTTEGISENINDFLYGSKKGHCEYFATTLAVSLIYFGYNPTLVSGYGYGEYNELANSYVIRGRNAHTWVELYDEEKGERIIYDATPGTIFASQIKVKDIIDEIIKVYDYMDIKWYTYIVNYTAEEQKSVFKYLFNKKIIIITYLFIIIIFYFFIKLIKFISFFLLLSKKEKVVFILSKRLKTKNNVIELIKKKDKNLGEKLEKYIYGGIGDFKYIELLKFIINKR